MGVGDGEIVGRELKQGQREPVGQGEVGGDLHGMVDARRTDDVETELRGVIARGLVDERPAGKSSQTRDGRLIKSFGQGSLCPTRPIVARMFFRSKVMGVFEEKFYLMKCYEDTNFVAGCQL
jgi:hypothetical protein